MRESSSWTAPVDVPRAAGSFNALFTHRVRVMSPGDIDGTLTGWLRAAYSNAT